MTYKEMMERRHQRGEEHVTGLCGTAARLCSECYADSVAYLEHLTEGVEPEEGDDEERFWRRHKLPFYDAWYEVANKKIRRKRGESV